MTKTKKSTNNDFATKTYVADAVDAVLDGVQSMFDDQNKKIDKRFESQEKRFDKKFEKIDKRFDEQDEKFEKRFDKLEKLITSDAVSNDDFSKLKEKVDFYHPIV